MESANRPAEILNSDVDGGEDKVDPVFVVDGEGLGSDRLRNDVLDGEAGELEALGVAAVGVLVGDAEGAGYVCAGLVGVESDGGPPLGDGGGGGVGGGDGAEEVLDEELLGGGPAAVPDKIDVNRR
ncbi:unnamed protein product [Cuscuta epithymum]|uniref:Uncharacterized protein n=1 Tax=Cuscuta epithymum TaxID=186058 RepID=A0AAV0E3K5_9ASTE|nr:unnamed protein product [Cuscuta epithymum]CAH9142468.1 unnamed protein product [Cuscuta epithymum]